MDDGFKVQPETINIIIFGATFSDRCAIGNILFKAPLETRSSVFNVHGYLSRNLICRTLRQRDYGERVFNVALMPDLKEDEFKKKLQSELIQKKYKVKIFLFVTEFVDGLLYGDDEYPQIVRSCCGNYKTRLIPVIICREKKPDYNKLLEATTWFAEPYYDIQNAPAFVTIGRHKVVSLFGNDLRDVIESLLQGRLWTPGGVAVELKEIELGDGVSLQTRFTEMYPTPDDIPYPEERTESPLNNTESDASNPNSCPEKTELNMHLREETIYRRPNPEVSEKDEELKLPLREKTIYRFPTAEVTERDESVYHKVVEEGYVPSMHVRVMVVGPNGAGKTTIIKRLQQELNRASNSTKLPPTKGLEINQNTIRCVEEDGQVFWEAETDGFFESLLTDRMAEGVRKSSVSADIQMPDAELVDEESSNLQSHTTYFSGDEVDGDTRLASYFDGQTSNESLSCGKTDISHNDDSVTIDSDETLINESRETSAEDEPSDKDKHHERIKNVYTTFRHADSMKLYFSIWDFAGQAAYYGMHQLFLSRNTVNMLVIDISKDMDKNLEGNSPAFTNNLGGIPMTLRESVEFWSQSIRAYSGDSDVPVIIVYTHIDKVKEEEISERAAAIEEVINFDDCVTFFIDNTKDQYSDESFRGLKDELLAMGKDLDSEKYIPAIWTKYDEIIDNQTLKLMSFQELSALLSSDDPSRLVCFLHYQHSNGRLLYFPNCSNIHAFENTLIFLDPMVLITFLNRIMHQEDYSLQTMLRGKRKKGRMRLDGLFDRKYIESAIEKDESGSAIQQNLDPVLNHLQTMHILVKLHGRDMEYYFMPCLLTRVPKICSFSRATSSSTTIVISFSPPGKHLSLYYQLISALSSRYMLMEEGNSEGEQKHLYRKCACFYVDEKKMQLLHVKLVGNDIFFQIFNFDHNFKFGGQKETTLCNSVIRHIRKKVNGILSMYTVCIQAVFRVVCPEHAAPPVISTVSVDDLIGIGSQLCQPNGLQVHPVERDILKDWISLNKKKGGKEKEIEDFVPSDKEIGRLCLRIAEVGVWPEVVAAKLSLRNCYVLADRIVLENPGEKSLQLLEVLFCWKRERAERATLINMAKALHSHGLTKYALAEACKGKKKTSNTGDELSGFDDRKPTGVDFIQLCDVIMVSNMEFLFLELGMLKAQIDNAKHDERTYYRIMYQLFTKWLESRGDDASFREIWTACVLSGMQNMQDITDKITTLLTSPQTTLMQTGLN